MTDSTGIAASNSKVERNKGYLIEQSKMLQDIIKRMASNSLELKKSGLVAWTALIGLGVTYRIRPLFGLALLLSLIVALLDVLYLQQERKFRNHFNILTKVICGYPFSQYELKILTLTDQIDPDALIDRVEGNFIKLVAKPEQPPNAKELVRRKAEQRIEGRKEFWIAAISWANLLYPIIFVISIALLFIPLPPLLTSTPVQTPVPTMSTPAATIPVPATSPGSTPVSTPSLTAKPSPIPTP